MAANNSDSELEVVLAEHSAKPRATPRPTPVRRRLVAGRGNGENKSDSLESSTSDSDDDDGSSDDASFFRLRGRPSDVRRPEELEAGTSSTETPHSLKRAQEPALQHSSPPVVNDVLSEASDSSPSEASDTSDGEAEVAASKKRKQLYADKQPRSKIRRSRSVSLTPPPGALLLQQQKEEEREATQSSSDSDVCVLESDGGSSPLCLEPQDPRPHNSGLDLESLDPSLQAVIGGGGSSGGGLASGSMPEKVQVEFQLVYDEAFLAVDVPATWVAKRWPRIKQHDRAKIEKKLSSRIAVVVFSTDTVRRALQAFSDNFPVDVVATDPVLMQGTTRVFLTSRLASVGNQPVHYIKVYPRSVFNRMRESAALARMQKEAELEQMQRDRELVRELKESAGSEGLGDMSSEAVDAILKETGAPAGIRIKVRSRAGKDVPLMVTAATKIKAIIDNYRRLAGLDEGVQVSLEFDSEKLSPESTVGETEIEDDDMLTAYCK
ncbi:hypothetical protein GGI07_003939 [Coemansia sp. Benny D115]|nr:hypothetical protein GGI07_003939 [Coemansia sp. Benny D115]